MQTVFNNLNFILIENEHQINPYRYKNRKLISRITPSMHILLFIEFYVIFIFKPYNHHETVCIALVSKTNL